MTAARSTPAGRSARSSRRTSSRGDAMPTQTTPRAPAGAITAMPATPISPTSRTSSPTCSSVAGVAAAAGPGGEGVRMRGPDPALSPRGRLHGRRAWRDAAADPARGRGRWTSPSRGRPPTGRCCGCAARAARGWAAVRPATRWSSWPSARTRAFAREGDDIVLEVPVMIDEAALGGQDRRADHRRHGADDGAEGLDHRRHAAAEGQGHRAQGQARATSGDPAGRHARHGRFRNWRSS